MPRILELKEIDGKLGVILEMTEFWDGTSSVSLWTQAEADKEAQDSEALGRSDGHIAGLKEALEICSKLDIENCWGEYEPYDCAKGIRARISDLEKAP
jgi:hypothetical protein